jgi:hypothetical protein
MKKAGTSGATADNHFTFIGSDPVITYDHISEKEESHYLRQLPENTKVATALILFEISLTATLFILCALMGFNA